MKFLKSKLCLILLLAIVFPWFGCSNSNQAILPSGDLSEEQKAAVKAEDARVEEEESQGKMNKPNTKKKS